MAETTVNGTDGLKHIIFTPLDTTMQPVKGLGEYLFERMKIFGDKTALINGLTGETLKYNELLSRCIHVAQTLQTKRIQSGDILSLCSYNNMHYVDTVVASFFIGALMAPLDPTSPLMNFVHYLKATRPKIIFCEIEFEIIMETAIQEACLSSELVVFGKTEKNVPYKEYLSVRQPEEKFKVTPTENLLSPAIIHFTSGTTGLSKPACVTHYGLFYMCSYFFSRHMEYDSMLATTSPYWISNTNCALITLLYGKSRLICRSFDKYTLKHIQDYKIPLALLTPVELSIIIQNPEYRQYDISSLKVVLTGGSPSSAKQFLQLMEIFPHTRFYNAYGMTEMAGFIFMPAEQHKENLKKYKKPTIGVPIDGIRYKVVNLETNEILGPNKSGELRVKFEGVLSEYYKQPKEYKNAFDKDGYLKTGDIMYYDDQQKFYYDTRLKDIFKYRMWHISPSIIENHLISHPDIHRVVVIGIPSNNEGEYPTAVIIPKSNTVIKEEDIIQYVKDKLPDRYHIRGGVFFKTSFPTSLNGKILRKQLREMIINETNA